MFSQDILKPAPYTRHHPVFPVHQVMKGMCNQAKTHKLSIIFRTCICALQFQRLVPRLIHNRIGLQQTLNCCKNRTNGHDRGPRGSAPCTQNRQTDFSINVQIWMKSGNPIGGTYKNRRGTKRIVMRVFDSKTEETALIRCILWPDYHGLACHDITLIYLIENALILHNRRFRILNLFHQSLGYRLSHLLLFRARC